MAMRIGSTAVVGRAGRLRGRGEVVVPAPGSKCLIWMGGGLLRGRRGGCSSPLAADTGGRCPRVGISGFIRPPFVCVQVNLRETVATESGKRYGDPFISSSVCAKVEERNLVLACRFLLFQAG